MKSFLPSLSEEWVKGPIAKTTARRDVFASIEDALSFGRKHADDGRSVAYSVDWLASATRRIARFVVTVRPTPAWAETDEVRAERARKQHEIKKAQEREFFRSQGA